MVLYKALWCFIYATLNESSLDSGKKLLYGLPGCNATLFIQTPPRCQSIFLKAYSPLEHVGSSSLSSGRWKRCSLQSLLQPPQHVLAPASPYRDPIEELPSYTLSTQNVFLCSADFTHPGSLILTFLTYFSLDKFLLFTKTPLKCLLFFWSLPNLLEVELIGYLSLLIALYINFTHLYKSSHYIIDLLCVTQGRPNTMTNNSRIYIAWYNRGLYLAWATLHCDCSSWRLPAKWWLRDPGCFHLVSLLYPKTLSYLFITT